VAEVDGDGDDGKGGDIAFCGILLMLLTAWDRSIRSPEVEMINTEDHFCLKPQSLKLTMSITTIVILLIVKMNTL